jgi:hypothetical protein
MFHATIYSLSCGLITLVFSPVKHLCFTDGLFSKDGAEGIDQPCLLPRRTLVAEGFIFMV